MNETVVVILFFVIIGGLGMGLRFIFYRGADALQDKIARKIYEKNNADKAQSKSEKLADQFKDSNIQ